MQAYWSRGIKIATYHQTYLALESQPIQQNTIITEKSHRKKFYKFLDGEKVSMKITKFNILVLAGIFTVEKYSVVCMDRYFILFSCADYKWNSEYYPPLQGTVCKSVLTARVKPRNKQNYKLLQFVIISKWYLKNRYQYEELGRFASGYGLMESPCKCAIDPPGSISHVVNSQSISKYKSPFVTIALINKKEVLFYNNRV